MRYFARLAQCVWRRRWWLFAALVLGLLTAALDAHAQTGTWAAQEQGWTDYIVIEPPILLVVRIDDQGRCLGAPMPTKLEGDTLRRERGADWRVTVRRGEPDTLTVTMADTSRRFLRTLYDPVARCTDEGNKI